MVLIPLNNVLFCFVFFFFSLTNVCGRKGPEFKYIFEQSVVVKFTTTPETTGTKKNLNGKFLLVRLSSGRSTKKMTLSGAEL